MKPSIFRLMLAHQRADLALRLEMARRLPDSARIQTLKKRKLRIKDRLHALSLGHRGLTPA
ncbi:MAG: YdcH family protein [Novosphingobium sp.]